MDEKQLEASVKVLGFDRVLKQLLEFSRPTTSDDTEKMIVALLNGLACVVAWDAHCHIQDHQGYECAKGIIEDIGEELKETSHEHLKMLLKLSKLPPMLTTEAEDHNAAVAAQILKEIEDAKD